MSIQSVEELQAQLVRTQEYIALLELENKQLKAEVEELSTNPNFRVYTRIAGFISAEKEIAMERRRDSSSSICLVAIDIGGMGNSNTYRGEGATNRAMDALLKDIRNSFRKGNIRLLTDGQLNSGDEFLFWLSVKIEDLPGIMARFDNLAKKHGFEGAYCGSSLILGEPNREQLIELANSSMKGIYLQKEKIKAAKSV